MVDIVSLLPIHFRAAAVSMYLASVGIVPGRLLALNLMAHTPAAVRSCCGLRGSSCAFVVCVTPRSLPNSAGVRRKGFRRKGGFALYLWHEPNRTAWLMHLQRFVHVVGRVVPRNFVPPPFLPLALKCHRLARMQEERWTPVWRSSSS